ncbi:MAG: hypothetical protein IPI40_03305 [Betaproteobacteria bacterium]|nr:hypothetical protein [Betaproteobacteria bacterium]
MICLAVLLAIVGQNLVGTALAGVFGQPAALGPFLGSIAFIGGHGTAVAWSNSPAASGIPTAFPVGIGSATLGLVLGGLAAGPIAAWLAARHGASVPPGGAAVADAGPVREPAFSSDRWLPCLLWIFVAMAIGPLLGAFAAGHGLKVPGFLAVLLIAVAVTNGADLLRRPLDTEVTDLMAPSRCASSSPSPCSPSTGRAGRAPAAAARQRRRAGGADGGDCDPGALSAVRARSRGCPHAAGSSVFGLGAMPVGLAVMRRLNPASATRPRAARLDARRVAVYRHGERADRQRAFFGALGDAEPRPRHRNRRNRASKHHHRDEHADHREHDRDLRQRCPAASRSGGDPRRVRRDGGRAAPRTRRRGAGERHEQQPHKPVNTPAGRAQRRAHQRPVLAPARLAPSAPATKSTPQASSVSTASTPSVSPGCAREAVDPGRERDAAEDQHRTGSAGDTRPTTPMAISASASAQRTAVIGAGRPTRGVIGDLAAERSGCGPAAISLPIRRQRGAAILAEPGVRLVALGQAGVAGARGRVPAGEAQRRHLGADDAGGHGEIP